jgi:hypothetical protein
MRSCLLLVGCWSALAAAAPRSKSAPPPPPPATKPKPAAVDLNRPTAVLMAELKAHYRALEYDAVIPLGDAVLAREDLAVEDRREALQLYGTAKAIVEDPVEAERPFRTLLRSWPDYDLPADTPPKILGVFRKVQSEERALAAQLREVERGKIVASLKLLGEPPDHAKGGRPLSLSFRLRDPTGAVETVRLNYKKRGEASFSSLALKRDDAGNWSGQLAADYTASENGFTLDYNVETLDAHGPLLSLGSSDQPKQIQVEAGSLAPLKPPPVPRGLWFVSLGLTAALGAGELAVKLSLDATQADYQRRAGIPGYAGSDLVRRQSQGQTLALSTTAGLIALSVFAALTAVLAPFTNWSNE